MTQLEALKRRVGADVLYSRLAHLLYGINAKGLDLSGEIYALLRRTGPMSADAIAARLGFRKGDAMRGRLRRMGGRVRVVGRDRNGAKLWAATEAKEGIAHD